MSTRPRNLWIKHCAENESTKVWLCIDSTNYDCAAKESKKTERGHSKSGKNLPVISYIVAVDAVNGRPITWFTNNGGMPDVKGFMEIFTRISSSGMQIEGIIADRGFLSQEILDLITEQGMDYVIMLKSSTSGAREVRTKYVKTIVA